jgi:hypothetical protein
MVCLVVAMVVATHKDDVSTFWLDNMCHMCEHNLEEIVVNEVTKMIASLAPWSWSDQSGWPDGYHDSALTLEDVVIHHGHKGDSCKKTKLSCCWNSL